MSIIKIKQDIELLEEELERISITITDPIERNEYKKELQRKIKKLNRTKHSLELLQQEQHELQSLRQEISSNKPSDELSSRNQDKKSLTEPQSKNGTAKELAYQNELEFDEIDGSFFDIDTDEKVESDWDVPSNESYDSWQDDSCILIPNDIKIVEDAKNATQFQTNISSSQISHQIYLSKREIWISTVFAILNFICPYIYTRRWKPLCIVFISLIFCESVFLTEDVFFVAPFISAIDNGIAINKSKDKLKAKSS